MGYGASLLEVVSQNQRKWFFYLTTKEQIQDKEKATTNPEDISGAFQKDQSILEPLS